MVKINRIVSKKKAVRRKNKVFSVLAAFFMKFFYFSCFLVTFHAFLVVTSPTLFSENRSFIIIRDTETEELLTDIVQKIFVEAKLNPKNAKVFIVQSDSINAFTTGNGYVFITSGMILKFKNPVNLIAVLCHETAHLSAGHINTMIAKLQAEKPLFWLSMLAGIAGSLATGSPDAMALLLGYQMTSERLFLRFSRDQEFAADALGAKFLQQMGYDLQALIEVFEIFEHLEIMDGVSGFPTYVRTHPRSIDRISALKKQNEAYFKTNLQRSGKAQLKTKCSPELNKKYARITAKLRAFLGSKSPFQQAPKNDYPKAIYLHRKGCSEEAINILKRLITTDPKDLYYKEALAQILEETGHSQEAVKYYEEICRTKNYPLIRVEYAKSLIQIHQDDSAIKILEKVQYDDPFNPEIFRLLAKAYGQKHRHGISFFMLAQEQMLLQNYPEALNLLKNSIKKLDKQKEKKYIEKARYFIELIEREMKTRRNLY